LDSILNKLNPIATSAKPILLWCIVMVTSHLLSSLLSGSFPRWRRMPSSGMWRRVDLV
jgi:hypothetical protein